MRIRILYFIAALALSSGACKPRPTTVGARFSQPPKGIARLLFTRVGPEHVKWSLIGERSWTSARADGSALSLEGVYPLNSPTHKGGTNVWEFDLETRSEAGKTAWKARVHGSNGVSAATSGTTEGELQLVVGADTEIILPARQSLAKIGQTELTLALPQ